MINQKGVDLIKSFESLHDGDKAPGLQPKMDPIGIWTEGYGRAMRDKKGNFIKGAQNKDTAFKNATIHTEAQASKALIEDLKIYERIVDQKLKIQVTENQRAALVSHTYNTGGSATLFDLINRKALSGEIYAWFTNKYVTADGKKLAGLVRRRKAEADLFFTP